MSWNINFCLYSEGNSESLFCRALQQSSELNLKKCQFEGGLLRGVNLSIEYVKERLKSLKDFEAILGGDFIAILIYDIQMMGKKIDGSYGPSFLESEITFFGKEMPYNSTKCGNFSSANYTIGTNKVYENKRTLLHNSERALDEIEKLICLLKLEKVLGFGPFCGHDEFNDYNLRDCFLYYEKSMSKLININSGSLDEYDILYLAQKSDVNIRILPDDSIIFYSDKFCRSNLLKFEKALQGL